MRRLISILFIIALFTSAFNSCKKDDSSGETKNQYNGKTTAQFNSDIEYRTWMAENLRTTKYNDGYDIPNVTDDVSWANLTTGAYCTYNNTTSADSIATFGLLYNFYTIESEKIAPSGWHIPTDLEWRRLIQYSGGVTFGGGGMKEAGTMHWAEPNYWGYNSSGFTALPSGFRHYQGLFRLHGKTAEWWSAESLLNTANSYHVGTDGASAPINTTDKRFGYSIRLVKD